MSSRTIADGGAFLLYDGTCGMCAKSVQWVLRREREPRTLRFASLQSEFALRVIARHPELRAVDSVLWYEPATESRAERILVRSSAVLTVAAYIGGVWRALAALGRLIPRPLRDLVYDFIARHRYAIAGIAPACMLPTPEQRARFVD